MRRHASAVAASAHRAPRPASGVELERRIKAALRFLPMPEHELRANCVLHDEDVAKYTVALREARATGTVIRDPRNSRWLRLS
jgi:hypothetical protein